MSSAGLSMLPVGERVQGSCRPYEPVAPEQRPQFLVEAVDLRLRGTQRSRPRLGQLQYHGPVFTRMRLLQQQAGHDEAAGDRGDGGFPQTEDAGQFPLGDPGLVLYREQRAELGRGDAGGGQAAPVRRGAQPVRRPLQQEEKTLIGLGHGPILTDDTGPRHPHFTSEVR